MFKKIIQSTTCLLLLFLLTLLSACQENQKSSKVTKKQNPLDSIKAKASEAYQSGYLKGGPQGKASGRTKVKPLFSFEDGEDGSAIKEFVNLENLDLSTVLDFGVTDGNQCMRVVAEQGKPWAAFEIKGDKIKDVSEYDYFAFDLFTNDPHEYSIFFELWDEKSRNYATRYTKSKASHPGRQTFLFPIRKAARNSKEALSWNQLKPEDKIDVKNLSKIKIFLTPRKDRPAQFWIDHVRLMQEDAAKPKMNIDLPSNIVAAYDFGSVGSAVEGFSAITKSSKFDKGAGFVSTEGLVEGGKGWPDLLTGTFVRQEKNQKFEFKTKIDNGSYRVLLAAGQIISPSLNNPHYLLKVNQKTIYDIKPTAAQLDSDEYIYRFMNTQYSRKPNSIWFSYIKSMYPVYECDVHVTEGVLSIEASATFLSSCIILPSKNQGDADRLAAHLTMKRIESYNQQYIPERDIQPIPQGRLIDVFEPDAGDHLKPWSSLPKSHQGIPHLKAKGLPGQNVFLRLGVLPYYDLGQAKLRLTKFVGNRGEITTGQMNGFKKHYRFAGRRVNEMGMLPGLDFNAEALLTQDLYIWVRIPEETVRGEYQAKFSLSVEALKKDLEIPVTIEVGSKKIVQDLPIGLGMYYRGRRYPNVPGLDAYTVYKDQMTWMKKIGFNMCYLPPIATVLGVDAEKGTVRLKFDDTSIRAAKAVGFGQNKDQRLITTQLSTARSIGRLLIGNDQHQVDTNPGIEFTHPKFQACWMDAMRQLKAFIDSTGMPIMCEVVDEPREVPNPWNRNLKETKTYGQWMAKAGLHRYVTPMADTNSGLDYTPLVDDADTVSIHATSSSKGMFAKTKKQSKSLWMYNSGMDRFTWGFYSWANGIEGRIEWHWSWPEGGTTGGYPGNEWFNPFTSMHSEAPNAPYATQKGGFVFTSPYFHVSEGITDIAYITTLEEAIKDKNTPEAQEAKLLLKEIKESIPQFPKGDAAKMARRKMADWRAKIWDLLQRI